MNGNMQGFLATHAELGRMKGRRVRLICPDLKGGPEKDPCIRGAKTSPQLRKCKLVHTRGTFCAV